MQTLFIQSIFAVSFLEAIEEKNQKGDLDWLVLFNKHIFPEATKMQPQQGT